MLFAHDTEASLSAAVALVNSAVEPDTLTEIEQLDAFYEEHGFTGRRDADAAELEAVRALRPVLRELLTADRDTPPSSSTRCSPRPRRVPQLRRHDGLDWHIHAVPADAPLERRVAVEAAMAMIDVIRADELSGSRSATTNAANASCSTSRATAPAATATRRARTATPSPPTARGRAARPRSVAEGAVDGVGERRPSRGARGRRTTGSSRLPRRAPAGAVVAAVDPHRRQPLALRWHVIVEQALRDVQQLGRAPARGREARRRARRSGSRRACRRRRPRP